MYSVADDAAAADALAVAAGHADADSTEISTERSTDSNGRNSSDSASGLSSHVTRPAVPSGDHTNDGRESLTVPRPPDVAPPMPPPSMPRPVSSRNVYDPPPGPPLGGTYT